MRPQELDGAVYLTPHSAAPELTFALLGDVTKSFDGIDAQHLGEGFDTWPLLSVVTELVRWIVEHFEEMCVEQFEPEGDGFDVSHPLALGFFSVQRHPEGRTDDQETDAEQIPGKQRHRLVITFIGEGDTDSATVDLGRQAARVGVGEDQPGVGNGVAMRSHLVFPTRSHVGGGRCGGGD